MRKLSYFVSGAVFSILLMPVIEALSVTIQSQCEVIKSKMAVEIAKNNKSVSEQDVEISHVNAIGFQIDDVCDEYYDEECKYKKPCKKG